MKIGQLTAIALLAAASAGFSAPAVSASYGVDIRVAPPAPRVEAVPAPRRGYVWAPGYWDWTGHRHHWVAGHWIRERHGYAYKQPEWVNEGDHWRLRRGAWARGDRDGDGVPNSRDRRPDDPNRR